MRSFTLHEAAEQEVDEAADYYEGKQAGLGRRFRMEFVRSMARIQSNPYEYAAEDRSGARLCVLNRFPYSVVYLLLNDSLWVIALAHHRRRPRYWANRLPLDIA